MPLPREAERIMSIQKRQVELYQACEDFSSRIAASNNLIVARIYTLQTYVAIRATVSVITTLAIIALITRLYHG